MDFYVYLECGSLWHEGQYKEIGLVSCNFFLFLFCPSSLSEEVVEHCLIVFKAQCSEILAEHVCILWVIHKSAHTACLQ